MTLSELLNITNEQKFKNVCNTYLTKIGSGTSRDVYSINKNYVIKVAKNDLGYHQNYSESCIYDEYKDLNLFAKIIKSSNTYLWVIQDKAKPLLENNDKYLQIVNLINQLELNNHVNVEDPFLITLKNFIIKSNWKFLSDFKKADSFGLINGNLHIIDYGVNNEVFDKFLKR
jgi:hypothetical protein